MVQAGSVEALLTLNTSGFNTGISSAVRNIESLVKTLNSISTNAKGFVNGLNEVTKSMTMLNDSFAQFDVSSKKANAFNQIANGMERLVNSARALAEGNMSVQATYQHMENVVNMFAQALSNADIKLKGSISTTRQLAEANSQLSNSHANFNKLSQEFLNIANNVSKISTNFKGFNISVSQTGTAISQVDTHSKRFIGTLTAGLPQVVSGMHNLTSDFQRLYTQMSLFDAKTNSFKRFQLEATQTATAINNMTMATERFNIALASSGTTGLTNWTSGINNLNTSLRATQTATNMTSTAFQNSTINAKGFEVSVNGAGRSTTQLKTQLDSASNSNRQFSQGMNSGVSSANRMNTATRGLTGTLNTLRSVVGLVGSMFLFNFAHNMLISVKNTVSAKSEMLSYLHTMGMTQNQINGFNTALDQTAERFQRINKYNIGETVANIGLEFDLSAKEMEKAMSVTSMITSEYLRAGRNADEAALAVKDIMQGQFQRLSRETGVKGETLKELGWSGDEKDVIGLMDALEKAAKSRHWDVFAEKANSLNDVVLITQNRLSEWATDMTENLTPIVTQSFNLLVAGITGFTTVLGQVGQALHLPDWTGTAVMVGGLALALGGLVTSTITARTGLGLLDIAHKGLGQSIIATIFNIDKESLANQKATTIAMGKVLGLNAQAVAERGLAGAIAQSMTQQELENIAKTQSNVISAETTIMRRAENLAKQEGILLGEALVFAQNEENLSNMRSITLLTAKALGLNMNTLAQEGFIIALGQRIALSPIYQAFLSEETAKNLGLAGAIGITMSALLPMIAVIGALAIAVGSWAVEVNNACQKMGEFNTLIKDGDNMIKDAKATTESYRGTVNKLNEEINSGTLTEEQARQKKVELAEASQMLRYAEDEEKDTIEAVERARSSQAKSEESRVKTATKSHGDMIELVRQLGYEYDQAADKANKFGNALDHGTRIEQELANHEEWNRGRTYDYLKDYDEKAKGKWSDEDIIKRNSEYKDVIEAQNREYAKMLTADGLGGYLEGLAGWKWNQGIEEMMKIQDYFNTGDFVSALDTFSHGIGEVLPLPQLMQQIFGDPEAMFSADDILNSLNNIGSNLHEMSTGLVKAIFDPLNNIGENLHEVVGGLWNKIGEAFSGLFSGEGGGGGLLPQKMDTSWILNGLFGAIDINGASEWFNNSIITPLSEAFNNFLSDPISALMLTVGDFGIFNLIDKIFGMDSGSDQAMSWSYAWVELHIAQPLRDALTNLPTTVMGLLTNTVNVFMQFANQLLQHGISAGSNFLNGVVSFISQLPSRVYSYISSTASSIISGASAWASNARSKASETVNAVINQVSQLPEKVYNEFVKIGERIRNAISGAVQAALQFGTDIKNAVLNTLGIHSPGIVQEKIATEFANIGGRIAESSVNVQTEASNFGQSIVTGMNSQMTNVQASADALTNAMNMTQADVVLDQSFVGDYQADANTIGGINQTMTSDTTLAFDTMGATVNGTINGITTNLQTSYMAMNTNQTTALTTMQNQNRTAYTNLQNQTTTSLNNMRSTTQNVTVQMINAWSHMKDSIISSADQLKTQSTAHFNTLSSNIGSFYQKLQNPSMWGGSPDGYKMSAHHYSPHRGLRGANEVRRAFGVPTSGTGGRRYAGSPSFSKTPDRMKLRDLKRLVGGSPVFNGLDLSQEVDVAEFLEANGLVLGWGDWYSNHFDHIKNTSGEWDMQGPMIMHRIPTGQSFKVKEFYDSQPKISFASFQHMAEALFSAIPYEYYFNSDAHGSWVGALQAGSCNCYDGANALVALAATCGFSGHTEGGTWNGIPHVYAVINGKKMDTTSWQKRGNWDGVAAGSPSNMKVGGESKTYNVNIDMSNATFYGEDDFKQKMETIAHDVLRREVNTSITVGY